MRGTAVFNGEVRNVTMKQLSLFLYLVLSVIPCVSVAIDTCVREKPWKMLELGPMQALIKTQTRLRKITSSCWWSFAGPQAKVVSLSLMLLRLYCEWVASTEVRMGRDANYICIGWSCVLNCFMLFSPTLFSCFLLICYPYIM